MDVVRAGELLVEDDGLTVTVLGGDGIDDALRLLDDAEDAADAPLVDEAERARLDALAGGWPEPDRDHWHPLLARRDGTSLGYAGVTAPPGGAATADLAVDRSRPDEGATIALFRGVRRLVARHGAGDVTVWVRHAGERDAACAAAAGYREERRLLILGRSLDDVPPTSRPDGWRVRTFRSGPDDRQVVDVLAAAFAGTPDAGWDLDRLEERRSYPWFDPRDVLVAERSGGGIAAVHWMKRRGDGIGEVYVLAVAPDAHGQGLGRTMLHAGLAHLVDVGCHDVILWVDASNEPAVALYRSEGFRERWTDVAFTAGTSEAAGR